MLLLDLMSLGELKETIEILRRKFFKMAAQKGFLDKRTIEISQRLDLYLHRYNELKNKE